MSRARAFLWLGLFCCFDPFSSSTFTLTHAKNQNRRREFASVCDLVAAHTSNGTMRVWLINIRSSSAQISHCLIVRCVHEMMFAPFFFLRKKYQEKLRHLFAVFHVSVAHACWALHLCRLEWVSISYRSIVLFLTWTRFLSHFVSRNFMWSASYCYTLCANCGSIWTCKKLKLNWFHNDGGDDDGGAQYVPYRFRGKWYIFFLHFCYSRDAIYFRFGLRDDF